MRFEAEKYARSRKPQLAGTNMTFAEILEFWMNSSFLSLKKSTLTKYSFLVNKHLIPDLGEVYIDDLNTQLLNGYMEYKLNSGRLDKPGGLSPAYASTLLIIIRSALKTAADEGLCTPAMTAVKLPRRPKKDVRVLRRDEWSLLEDYLQKNNTPTAVGIALSLYMGLRIGEICALRWEDVELDERIIQVRSTLSRVAATDSDGNRHSRWIIEAPKTLSSRRELPIPSVLVPMLSQLKKWSISEFAVSEKPGFTNPRTFDYRFHRVLEDAGIEWVNFHALRHSFATRCVEAGMDVKTLSEILGHSNVSITLNTYVHSSMERKRSQIELVTGG